MLPSMETFYEVFLILVILGSAVLGSSIDWLNLKSANPRLPQEFEGYYDPAQYQKSQLYLRTNTLFEFFKTAITTPITLIFVFAGGFNILDQWARRFSENSILVGLLFTGSLVFLSGLFSLPFSIYHTFVIEERFGFNRTTIKVFVADLIKGAVLGGVIGAFVLSTVLWFFEKTGPQGWLWSWFGVTLFQVILIFLAPAVIMPLFNKFTPLPSGELREAIERYAKSQNFQLEGIYTMDGSKRSSKANAFFTGFGRFRRIVLFDTLIEKHTTEELVAVLAHEIGHFKRRHILKQMALSILTSGLLFYLLSLFL